MRSLICILSFVLAANAHAQSLECRFELSASNTFEAGAWREKSPSDRILNFKFSEFDHHKQKARKESSIGVVDVWLLQTTAGVTIMDAIPTGDIALTSIKEVKDGFWVGTHSRHRMKGKLQPLQTLETSQYIGECKTR